VTFLFTDIEGSTNLWERYPHQMQAALERHDAILRSAIEAHSGYVFKTMGDAFCAAFSDPSSALASAMIAQHTLHTELWTKSGVLRVRMALHTGIVQMREEDYFGQPLNRVARLLSAGHGGQTLLSQPTYDLVRDHLSPGMELSDLGEHRLKDLIRPERVYQVVASDLPADFPPLRTLDNRPNNLPRQPTALIGREKETMAACALIRRPNMALLTLTGPGGTGKTRLALQVAADLLDDFPDGVWFVELAALTDPSLVISTIAHTLGVKEAAGQPLIDTLKTYLKERQLLLLLDNFEQLLGHESLKQAHTEFTPKSVDASREVSHLLAACPRLKVVVTSRVVLHLRGEHEYAVPSLMLPDHRHLPSLERLAQYEAVRLFIERATEVRSDFEVTNDNAPAVAEICVRLDGLPLAIELAAARIKILTPQAMLTRVQSRLKLLTGGARDLPARQQTLRNTIEWSYELLEEGEKQLFARMAVFQGGRTLEALEAICNFDGQLQVDVLDGVESLVSKSLLRQEKSSNGGPRFVMLETIHEYAREKLTESGEEQELRRKHAEYFRALTSGVITHKLHTMEEEQDNVRAALSWALEMGDMEAAFGLVDPLVWFCYQSGYNRDGLSALEPLLAKSSDLRISGRAMALMRANQLEFNIGHYERALAFSEEAVSLYRELGIRERIGWALGWMARAAMNLGDLDRAEVWANEKLAVDREQVDKGIKKLTTTSSFGILGELAHLRGDYSQAKAYYEQELQLQRGEVEDPENLASTLLVLGLVANHLRDYRRALELFSNHLSIIRQYRIIDEVPRCLMGIAGASMEGPQPQSARRAATLLGASEAIFETMDAKLPRHHQIEYDRYISAARAKLDEAAWQAAWAEGRAMSMEQAIAYAQQELEQPE
jgi:predicted ATPase/class 3 adenylate cyclase